VPTRETSYLLRRGISFGLTLSCFLFAAGCSSSDSAPHDGGTGASPGTGGDGTTGGSTGTGGDGTTGGSTGTGGRGGTTGSGGGPGDTGGSGSLGGTNGGGGHGTGGQAGAALGAGGSGGRTNGQAGGSGMAGAAGGHAGGGGSAAAAGGRGGTAGAGGLPGAGGGSGAGGMGGLGPEAPGGRVTGYGTVLISANSKNQIVRLQTTLAVPAEPPPSGTLFLWPGLQPNGANYDPIDNGVLQPVLTWGSSCAPGRQPRAYSTWWISAQYVNTFGSDPGYTGCQGGPVMSVDVGDTLNIDMALAGTIWTQTVTDAQTGQSVAYSIDMMNQAQNLAYYVIEEYSSAPVSEVIFTDSTITFGSADSADCKLAMRGQNDYVSVPVPSSDGRSCAIQEIILRAQGIP
jgi:hypothetical protein